MSYAIDLDVHGTITSSEILCCQQADFQSLMRSYPHMPCFRRVCGVINLASVASNASSLRGKPAEEKGSLSRLSNLVLGESPHVCIRMVLNGNLLLLPKKHLLWND